MQEFFTTFLNENSLTLIIVVTYFLAALGLYLITLNSVEKRLAIFAFVPILNIYLLVKLAGYDAIFFAIFIASPFLMFYNLNLIIVPIVLYSYIIILLGIKTGANPIYTLISIPLFPIGFFLMWTTIRDNAESEIYDRYERHARCESCKTLCGTDKTKTDTIKCRECGEWVYLTPLPKTDDHNKRKENKNKKPIELRFEEESREQAEQRIIDQYKENFEKKY